jgi:hypothetical protein
VERSDLLPFSWKVSEDTLELCERATRNTCSDVLEDNPRMQRLPVRMNRKVLSVFPGADDRGSFAVFGRHKNEKEVRKDLSCLCD